MFDVVVAWTAWGTMYIKNDWSWRSLTLIQVFPAVIQIIFIWCRSPARPEAFVSLPFA